MDRVKITVEWDLEVDGHIPIVIPPEIVDVPEYVYDEGYGAWYDPVADWLSDKYGFCVKGWRLTGRAG